MANTEVQFYRRIGREARPYYGALVGILCLELLAIPLALLSPVPLQIAVDSVIQGRAVPHSFFTFLPHGSTKALLFGVCVLSIAIVLLSQLRGLACSILSTYTGQTMLLGFRAKLFRHALNLSLSYHTERTSTDAIYRIQQDANALDSIFVDALIPAITSFVTLVSMLVVLLSLNFQIGCIALVVAPILFFMSRLSRPILRTRSKTIKQQESQAMGVVQEVLGLLRVVKAFGQEEREQNRFVSQYKLYIQSRIKLNLWENGLSLGINLVTAGGVAFVLYVGVNAVIAKALTLGQLLLIMNYVRDLYSPLKTISRKMVTVQSHLAGLERTFTFLDEPTDVPEHPSPRTLERVAGRVTFEDVHFRYNTERETLQEVSFHVEPGEKVGIVGVTGAGKTTLMNLLLRLYDPSQGQVRLDGVDIREYRIHDLRDQFAVVLQEAVLFSGTIAENIAYGCPHATQEEIEAAAKAANVHHFIEGLPKGYLTRVGERGMAVSGGERQRIALARAFLKNAPVLLLDEPTSSVDGHTESVIIEAMERLMEGRTTFIIAHRLNTIEHCDVLIRMDHGRLVEFTRKAELLA